MSMMMTSIYIPGIKGESRGGRDPYNINFVCLFFLINLFIALGRFEDEKNGIICQNWIRRSWDFLDFSGKYGDFRHFKDDVICLKLKILWRGFL